MKKVLSMTLVLVMCLSLFACESTDDNNQAQATSDQKEVVNKLSLGEKASTDRAEFTLEKSELTYYMQYNGDVNAVLTPVSQAGDTYAASLGDCFVALTFTLTNKDRTSISYGGPMPEWDPKWSVSYGGKDYTVNGFEVMEGFAYIDLRYAAIVDENGRVKEVNPYANFTLSAGETVTIRTFGVIDVAPKNLTDGYDFTVGIINSTDEYEYFTYTIPTKK